MVNGRIIGLAGALLHGASAALAGTPCTVEHAVYGEIQSGAHIEFAPVKEGATVTNGFSMKLDNGVVLDGIVMWSEGVRRANGMLMYKCPDGDVTGAELDACIVWQGVMYSADKNGQIAMLPAEGAAAPDQLILAGLGPSLRLSAAYGDKGFKTVPWDVFSLTGCKP